MIIHTLIVGIVEGLTEFIPVSSTAHLLLTGALLGIPQDAFLEALSICIQSGAILAVVFYFWKFIWKHLSIIPKIAVAFIPTSIAGVLLYPLIKSALGSTAVIALALIVGGIGILLIKPIDTETAVGDVSYKQAFWIGVAQIGAFIPGISRAGATLIGGTLLKIPRQTIVSFSFLLAIPTILGASVVEIRHVSGLTTSQWGLIGFGTIIAFITALISIRFFMNILTRKPLAWFGWYRIILGIVVLLVVV